MYQAVRELVENALDATDSHGILPLIKVYINREGDGNSVYSVTVEDNGIGIPPNHIPQAFGQLLYSSKYVLRQTRGMFGLGAKMAVLYGQITTGKPVEVVSSTINSPRIYYFRLRIDIKNNRPVVEFRGSYTKTNGWHGTIVRVRLQGDWTKAKSRIYDYLRRTAIIAPYSEIIFSDPDGNVIYFERATKKMPLPPREVKPHPKGVDLEMMKTMLHSTTARTLVEFLMKEFQNVGWITASNIVREAGLDPDADPRKLRRKDVEALVRAIKELKTIKPPRGNHLSYVGKEIITAGLKAILKPEFVEAVTRKPSVYEGHAFIVEVGVAYGGGIKPAEEPVLLRYANKIPLLYDEKSDVAYKVIKEKIDWSNYGVNFPAPIVVLIHICSTKIPYKGVGKESIADVPEVEKEIENALREVLRKLRVYITRKRKEREEAEKAVSIAKYIPEVSRALSRIVKDVKRELIEKELLKMLNSKLKAIKINTIDDIVESIE